MFFAFSVFALSLKNFILHTKMAVSADAQAGISFSYMGADLGARLIKAGTGFKLPIPFTDKKLLIKGEGELFAVGFRTYWDLDEGTMKVGLTPIFGKNIVLGIVD